MIESLTREAVKNVIEGKGAGERVPVAIHFWNGPGAFVPEQIDAVCQIRDRYPSDIHFYSIALPEAYKAPESDSKYRWINYKDCEDTDTAGALDSNDYISDMESEIDLLIENMPNPYYADLFAHVEPNTDNRYAVCHWWYCLFERHWWLRGMENALTDFYLYPEAVHKLYRALTDFYKVLIVRAKNELSADGIFVSDDIGTQTGPFFSLDIFNTFFLPYYRELIEAVHQNGMHFWLHSCGNIKEFLPGLIDAGLDVIHPIQKYTMDEKDIADEFGGKICFWAGFDVQQIIPYGTAEDVRCEVDFLKSVFQRPDGRLILAAGNGITGDCPLESLDALYESCYEK